MLQVICMTRSFISRLQGMRFGVRTQATAIFCLKTCWGFGPARPARIHIEPFDPGHATIYETAAPPGSFSPSSTSPSDTIPAAHRGMQKVLERSGTQPRCDGAS